MILRQLETDKPKVYFQLRRQCYAFIWHFQIFTPGHLTSFSNLACSNLDSVPWTHFSPVYLMVRSPLSKKKKNATKLTLKMKEGAFSRSQGASAPPIHYLSLIKFSHPQNYKRINLCCFKPLRLWCLIAVVGNRQREKAQPHTTLPWFPPVMV